MALVDARWVAGYEARFETADHPQNGTVLVPHETVIKGLSEDQVAASSSWEPVSKAKAKAGGDD